jgi:KRAB domain-containing zinc finger protein
MVVCDISEIIIFNTQSYQSAHSTIKTFVCLICDDAKYKTNSQLNTHRQRIHANANYTCDVCNRKFKTNAQLARHQSVHGVHRNYRCDACNSMFKSIDQLKNHKRQIHANIRIDYDECIRNVLNKTNIQSLSIGTYNDRKKP